MKALYSIDLGERPPGMTIGGQFGVTIVCPKCARGSVLFRKYFNRQTQQTMREYAHVLSFSLNRKNEPEMHGGEICQWPDDPSARAARGAK